MTPSAWHRYLSALENCRLGLIGERTLALYREAMWDELLFGELVGDV